jgi:hypothetical protein
VLCLIIGSIIFDYYWGSSSSIPLLNINSVYGPPKEYNNETKINLKLLPENRLVVQGNRKFRLINSEDGYRYIDTLMLTRPQSVFSHTNKIYLNFENLNNTDSIYLVISGPNDNGKFYNQVFFSSVVIDKLNKLSDDDFNIDFSALLQNPLLENNDTLINSVFLYFNSNAQNLGLADCGKNSSIFKKICDDFKLPCRIIWLQGGDMAEPGLDIRLGYPLHVVCEIYSSHNKNWYVVDPTYGIRFKEKDNESYLNAAEISNLFNFKNSDKVIQDSILINRTSIVGKDYFKYYENVIYWNNWLNNSLIKKFLLKAYPDFNHFLLLYSGNFSFKKNGLYYFGLKTFMYFIILIFYINMLVLVLFKRLFSAKRHP